MNETGASAAPSPNKLTHRFNPRFRAFLAAWREPHFWRLVLSSFVLIALAYQVPFHFELALGSPVATPIDQPFLARFYPAEQGQNQTYRWTQTKSAIVLDGIGSGAPLRLVYRAMTLRPKGFKPPRVTISMDGKKLGEFSKAADWQDYTIDIPSERNPDRIRLDFKTATFHPGSDPRHLGILISAIRIEPEGPWTLTMPSPWQTFLFVFLTVGLYATLRQLGMNPRRVFWVGLACLAAIALLIARARPFYTAFSPNIIALVVLNFIFALVVPRLARGMFMRAGVRSTPAELFWICLVFLIGFNVRWIAEMYPTTMFGDSLFHLHRLDATIAGQILRSSTAGAIGFEQAIPYPPALYLIVTPFAKLVADHLALLKTFVSFVDAFGAFLVYLMVRITCERSRPALFGAALYLFLPIAVLDFAWAIYANLLAQFALLAALTLWFVQARRATRAPLFLFACALGIGFLSHITAPIIWVGYSLVAVPLFWFGFKLEHQALVVRPVFITVAVLAAAAGLYYAEFVPLMASSVANVAAARGTRGGENASLATVGGGVKYPGIGLVRVRVYSIGEWVAEGAKGLAREAWVYFAAWSLALAPVGFYVLGRTARGRLLAYFGWAGLVAGLVFALVGVLLDLHVRYPLFLLPFAAMGSGVALDALCERGRAAALAVGVLLTVTAGISLFLWKYFF